MFLHSCVFTIKNIKKTLKNAFKAASETLTPTKSQRAKNVNSGLSTFLTPTKK